MTCPKCSGYVYHDNDRYGSWVECLMCGWIRHDGKLLDFVEETESRLRRMEGNIRKRGGKVRWG